MRHFTLALFNGQKETFQNRQKSDKEEECELVLQPRRKGMFFLFSVKEAEDENILVSGESDRACTCASAHAQNTLPSFGLD